MISAITFDSIFFCNFSCSVTCCRKHKDVCVKKSEFQNDEVIENKISTTQYNFHTEDTVAMEKLEELRYSDEIKTCLKNPQVRDIIRGVLSSPNSTVAIAKAMTEPIFVELADACLKIVEPSDNDKPY